MTSAVKYSIAISIQVSGQLGLFGYAQDKSTSENRDIHWLRRFDLTTTCIKFLQKFIGSPKLGIRRNIGALQNAAKNNVILKTTLTYIYCMYRDSSQNVWNKNSILEFNRIIKIA
ncbi:hypothetical protein PV325_002782 [Microctonus aethiopoides]|uniref:Uncharacterized protein n=1 Tax=Microctonus aethiopoides TaxID=144406 RepID=A0AA39F8G8_9HYME|nr:hypothetical protein PV326_009759 [Microctonus aethiopoides]KAK0086654.1 hypothetical protein PV325_002782 [Microctonus aethiopoides]KAK0164909.1 hypothetical protein PV328_003476 [Microctonus aethiopoides]